MKKGILERLEESYNISKYHIAIFIVLGAIYYSVLKFQQQWIIVSKTIDMHIAIPA